MKVFRCDHCRQLVFFENVRCVSCGHPLAYLPDIGVVGSLDPAEGGLFKSPLSRAAAGGYRLCANYVTNDVCNWAIPADDPDPLCRSCRITTVIPDLDVPGHREKWYKVEIAKRRLLYTLLALKLPVVSKEDDTTGVAFEFKADPKDPKTPKVLTGHADGVITLNIAEADDAERERVRALFGEPYRTLVGHFRHESGHYYWDRLVKDSPRIGAYRALFGDESIDYGEALKRHHAAGPPADWQARFVSSYASVHPWEDWAETWAHYLHIVDSLETAAACGVRLRPPRAGDPALRAIPDPVDEEYEPFDDLMESWLPLTYLLNNLNRGLGLADGYPFVLSGPAVEKLRFVHDTVWAARPGERHQ
jgi:hypothetical protein